MRAWYVALAVWTLVALGFFAILLVRPRAADAITCAIYAANIEQWTLVATNDEDVAQAARTTSETWCSVLDEPPIIFQTELSAVAALAPPPPPPRQPSAKEQWCRKNFRSYHDADGTVLQAGSRKRTKCPWPG